MAERRREDVNVYEELRSQRVERAAMRGGDEADAPRQEGPTDGLSGADSSPHVARDGSDGSVRVVLWYALVCLLPFVLCLVLPVLVWRSSPPTMSVSQLNAWAWSLLLAGWLPYLVGICGRGAVTSAYPSSPATTRWRTPTKVLAWVLGIWGVLASLGVVMLVGLTMGLSGVGNGL